MGDEVNRVRADDVESGIEACAQVGTQYGVRILDPPRTLKATCVRE